jgi:hypothetical protein
LASYLILHLANLTLALLELLSAKMAARVMTENVSAQQDMKGIVVSTALMKSIIPILLVSAQD